MSTRIDVYRDWLKIEATNRPLTHYQLLRLKQFEDDTALIRKHYRRLNAHVRKYISGEFVEESQALLSELAKAMLCLTDAQRKRDYDASLGRKTEGPGRRRSFEEILLGNKVLDTAQLDRARKFSDAVGLDLHQAVLQQKLAEPSVVMMAFAESIGLPFIDLSDIGIDEQLIAMIPPLVGRQHSCVPVMVDGGQLLMASPSPLLPDVEEDLRLRFEMPVRTVICTPGKINEAVQTYYPRDGGAAAAAAATRAAKATPPAAAAGQQRPVKTVLTEEDKKKRTQYAVVAGNFGVIATVFALYFTRLATGLMIPVWGVLGGAVIAGVTFFVMTTRLKNS